MNAPSIYDLDEHGNEVIVTVSLSCPLEHEHMVYVHKSLAPDYAGVSLDRCPNVDDDGSEH